MLTERLSLKEHSDDESDGLAFFGVADSPLAPAASGTMSPKNDLNNSPQVIAGIPKCIHCDCLLFRTMIPESVECGIYRCYTCQICGEPGNGNRWFCNTCSHDSCFSCHPDAITLPISQHATVYHCARRLLRGISAREADEGVPYVGVLLIAANLVKETRDRIEETLRRHGMTSDYKVGLLRVVPLPGDENYFILHPSSNTMKNICSYGDALNLHSCVYDPELKLELFLGVRMCDPFFGGDPTVPRSNNFLNLRALDGDDRVYRFKFAEIFAGIGGFRLGLEPLGGKCVFHSELNEAARATMSINFEPTGMAGDITGVYSHQLPNFDMLTAGFPCQPFSVRGEQAGLQDPRGQLYRELMRILRAKRPKCFLFENVPGLVYARANDVLVKGKLKDGIGISTTFEHILKEFESTGYCITWKIIDANSWLPQNRQRVFIVGFRNDLFLSDQEIRSWQSVQGPNAHILVRDILEHCPHSLTPLTQAQWDRMQTPEYLNRKSVKKGINFEARTREIFLDDKAPTLTSGYKNPGNETTRYIFEELDGRKLNPPRFLTPRECCRIMGFPESFKLPDIDDIAARTPDWPSSGGNPTNMITAMDALTKRESQFYHQIGNAVCPPVIQAIGYELLRILNL